MVWILAVGSDARPGEDMTRTRGDALQLVGMNTRTGAATAIGIPRDSWVDDPRPRLTRRSTPRSTSAARSCSAETVGNLVGIQPDYVFVTRFKYFQAMIDDIGGIDVRNPIAFDDTYLKPQGLPGGQDPPRRVRRHGVLPDPAQPAPRRLRPLGEPAAGAARHPGAGPRAGRPCPASSSAAC